MSKKNVEAVEVEFDNIEQFIKENAGTDYVKDSYVVSGYRLGVTIQVVGKIDKFEYLGNKYSGWELSNSTADRRRVLTPRHLANLTHYPEAQWTWVDGKKDETAFVTDKELGADQLRAMNSFLSECKGKLRIVGKAKHPANENAFIYAYAPVKA